MTIRSAHISEAELLSSVAYQAKAHWGYPTAWLELWKDDLTIITETITSHDVFVYEQEGRVVAVGALCPFQDQWEIEHFWVLPEVMGQGIGRTLLNILLLLHEISQQRPLRIVSDPHAASFYRHMGAIEVGQEDSAIEGRYLPIFTLTLDLPNTL